MGWAAEQRPRAVSWVGSGRATLFHFSNMNFYNLERLHDPGRETAQLRLARSTEGISGHQGPRDFSCLK